MQSMNTAEIEIASELLGIQAWNNSWKQESHLGLDKCHIALYGSRTPEELRHVTKENHSHHFDNSRFYGTPFLLSSGWQICPYANYVRFSWNSRGKKEKLESEVANKLIYPVHMYLCLIMC